MCVYTHTPEHARVYTHTPEQAVYTMYCRCKTVQDAYNAYRVTDLFTLQRTATQYNTPATYIVSLPYSHIPHTFSLPRARLQNDTITRTLIGLQYLRAEPAGGRRLV